MKKNRRAALALPQARRFLAAIKGQGRAACAVAAEAGDERGGAKDAACRARRARRKAAGLPASNAKSGAKQPVSPLPRGQSRYRRFCACPNGLRRNRGSQAAENAAPAVGEGAVPDAANGVNAGRQKNRVLKTKGGGFAFCRRFCACANGLRRSRDSQAAEIGVPAVGEAAVPAAANGVNTGKQKNRVLKTKGGGFAFLLVFYCSGDGLRRAKSPAEMQLAQGFTARTSSIIGRRISSRMPGCASSASGGCASRTASRQNPCDNRPINSCVSV